MIRLKRLPAWWREKVKQSTQDGSGTIKSKRLGKSKDNIKTQSYGSFEAILDLTSKGTYRIKEVIK